MRGYTQSQWRLAPMNPYYQLNSVQLVLRVHLHKLIPSQILPSTSSDLEQRRENLVEVKVSHFTAEFSPSHVEVLRLDFFHLSAAMIDNWG